MTWRSLGLLFLLMAATASEQPLDRVAYAQAAFRQAAQIEQGDKVGAAALSQAIAQRGWQDQGILLPADPAFIGTGYQDQDRIAALKTLAAVLTETPRTISRIPDPMVLTRLRPAHKTTEHSEALLLPDIPDSLAGMVDWIQRTSMNALRWLGDVLRDLMKWLLPQHKDGGGTDITQLVVGLCLVLVTVLVSAVAILWWRHRRVVPPLVATQARTAMSEEAIDRPQSEWERRGESLLAAGDHRGALRAFFHSALAAAFSAGRLHHRRGRTNWEYVAQIPAHSSFRMTLVSLVLSFERSWYGGHETTAEDCRNFRASVSTLTRSLRDPEVAA